jgi:hypothetical protein
MKNETRPDWSVHFVFFVVSSSLLTGVYWFGVAAVGDRSVIDDSMLKGVLGNLAAHK